MNFAIIMMAITPHPTVIIVDYFSRINNFSFINIYPNSLVVESIFFFVNTITSIDIIVGFIDLIDYNLTFIFISLQI